MFSLNFIPPKNKSGVTETIEQRTIMTSVTDALLATNTSRALSLHYVCTFCCFFFLLFLLSTLLDFSFIFSPLFCQFYCLFCVYSLTCLRISFFASFVCSGLFFPYFLTKIRLGLRIFICFIWQ